MEVRLFDSKTVKRTMESHGLIPRISLAAGHDTMGPGGGPVQ